MAGGTWVIGLESGYWQVAALYDDAPMERGLNYVHNYVRALSAHFFPCTHFGVTAQEKTVPFPY